MMITTRRDCLAILVVALPFVAIGIFAFVSVEEMRLKLGILGLTALFGSMIPLSFFKLLEIARHEKIEDRPELILAFARTRLEIVLIGVAMLMMAFFFYTPRFMGMTGPIMPALMAWLGALMALLGILMPLFLLLRPRRLTLSPQGLDYSLFGIGLILWRDIVSVDQGKGLKVGSIHLQLANREMDGPSSNASGQAHNSKGNSLVIKSHHLGTLPPVVLNAIKLRLKAFGEQRQ
jgi:hypothetical protein